MEKKIAADIGYRIEYPDGKTEYFGGFTGEGFCYKDNEAYKSGKGICYISEASLEDLEDRPMTVDTALAEGVYNTKSLRDGVRSFAGKTNVRQETMESFVENATDLIFWALEWEEPQTRMNETDWDALADEWNVIKQQK